MNKIFIRLRACFDSYFASQSPDIESVSDSVWADSVSAHSSSLGVDQYHAALMEQYKLYVEMADRVSARRALANAFFLTLNTSLFFAFSVLFRLRPDTPKSFLLLPMGVLLVLCLMWFWLVRSYRQLNAGKYVVIGALEQRLPASPFWEAEWAALGMGKNKQLYWPLAHVEQWVPLVLGAAYTCGLIVLAF